MTEILGDQNLLIAQQLRDAAMNEITTRGMDQTSLAEELDIFPDGARRILNQTEWPVSLGLRVLEALDVSVDVQVSKRTDE